jgi:hypothetical protein
VVFIDIFELQCIDERLQAVGHLLRGVWVDDEDGPHLAISELVVVSILAHGLCLC